MSRILINADEVIKHNDICVTLISNIVLEPYLSMCLEEVQIRNESKIKLTYVSYEELGNLQKTNTLAVCDYIVVFLNFHEFYRNAFNDIEGRKLQLEDLCTDVLVRCKVLYKQLKSLTYSPILWFGFEDYFEPQVHIIGNIPLADFLIDRINYKVSKIVEGDSYVDLKRLIASIGIGDAYCNKNKYRWNSPYSQPLIKAISNEIVKQYHIRNGITPKCVILDCDNVLWGGTLSEDGFEKIKLSSSGLGREYQDFQRFILTLYQHGVILAICSKNDLPDVLKMFREHGEMILKEEHISYFAVNWNNKVENIREIVRFLNIGYDSVVFIDDSDFEIHMVSSMLPEITTFQYKRDTIYDQLRYFNLKKEVDLERILQRTATYQFNVQREKLKSEYECYEQYLDALEMQIDIRKASIMEIERIAELTQRTNKYTNGKRYTTEQLKKITANGNYALFSVTVSDKFSNLGLVGAFGICNDTLDMFSLSCRALGRRVENAMIDRIRRQNVLKVFFAATGKNSECKKLLYAAIGEDV